MEETNLGSGDSMLLTYCFFFFFRGLGICLEGNCAPVNPGQTIGGSTVKFGLLAIGEGVKRPKKRFIVFSEDRGARASVNRKLYLHFVSGLLWCCG